MFLSNIPIPTPAPNWGVPVDCIGGPVDCMDDMEAQGKTIRRFLNLWSERVQKINGRSNTILSNYLQYFLNDIYDFWMIFNDFWIILLMISQGVSLLEHIEVSDVWHWSRTKFGFLDAPEAPIKLQGHQQTRIVSNLGTLFMAPG